MLSTSLDWLKLLPFFLKKDAYASCYLKHKLSFDIILQGLFDQNLTHQTHLNVSEPFFLFQQLPRASTLLPTKDDTAIVSTTVFYHQHQIYSILLADIQSSVIHRAKNHHVP